MHSCRHCVGRVLVSTYVYNRSLYIRSCYRHCVGRVLVSTNVYNRILYIRSCAIAYWDQRLVELFRVLLPKNVFGWFGCSTFSTRIKLGWNGWKSIVGTDCCCFPREQKNTMNTRHVYPVDPWTGRLQGSLVMIIPRSDRVSTENGWKSVPLESVNPLT